MLTADQAWQIMGFLLVIAVAPDLVDTEVGVRPIGQGDRGRGPGEFFHCNRVLKVTHSGTPEILFHCDPEQSERAHLQPQVLWKCIPCIDIGGARGDFCRGELGYGFPEHFAGLSQIEVEQHRKLHEIQVVKESRAARLF